MGHFWPDEHANWQQKYTEKAANCEMFLYRQIS
jgi:hypothetical protein